VLETSSCHLHPILAANYVAALLAALVAEQLARHEAEARASGAEATVVHLKLGRATLRHKQFGASSERSGKLLDQFELQLEKPPSDAETDDGRPTLLGRSQ